MELCTILESIKKAGVCTFIFFLGSYSAVFTHLFYIWSLEIIFIDVG